METTKKVWCVTNEFTDSIRLFEKSNTAKRLYANLIRAAKKEGGKIIIFCNKKHEYFSTFLKTKENTAHWIRCQKMEISQY